MEPLLEVDDLRVRFPVHGGVLLRQIAEVKAVDGVSFSPVSYTHLTLPTILLV